jgi:hypothetical protein
MDLNNNNCIANSDLARYCCGVGQVLPLATIKPTQYESFEPPATGEWSQIRSLVHLSKALLLMGRS